MRNLQFRSSSQNDYEVLNNVTDTELQNEILKLFNANSGIAKHLNPNEVDLFQKFNSDFLKKIKRYKIPTYKGLLKFLKCKIDYATEQMVYNLSKILGENNVNEMFVSRNIIETCIINNF